MTPSELPDRSQAADSIDRFLASVSTWLHWYKLVRMEEDLAAGMNPIDTMPVAKALLEPYVVPSPSPEVEAAMEAHERQSAAHRAFELTGKQNAQGAKVRDAGRTLAVTLEFLGHDSTPVLTIVHCTEAHGGGPAYVLPRWEDLKDRLRRVAIQLRMPAPRRREERKLVWGKRALRKLLSRDYQVGEDRLQRFIEGLRKAGNAGTERRRLWVFRDAAHSGAPTAFPRRPRKCPKCSAETACASCGRCPTCSGGACACGDAPGLEGDFLAQ